MADLVLVQLQCKAKLFLIQDSEKNLFNNLSAMALSLVISCSLIINLLGKVEPLDFRHKSCFIPFQSFCFCFCLVDHENFIIIILVSLSLS